MSEFIVDMPSSYNRDGIYYPDERHGGIPIMGEVVRCRDCKHSEPEREDSGRDWYQGGYWCELLSEGIGWFCEPDGFCSWGERRDADG